jgi:predicted DsbA family dithiol-disulfide isomerase
MIRVTYYLEVISSWCYWAEPAWAELKKHYAGEVEFEWKIALMDATGLPASREQLDWFYRRSGTIVRSPFMLNSGWFEPGVTEYLAPNLVAEAAKDLGASDDGVRLAIAEAALRQGKKVHRTEDCVAIAAAAGKLEANKLNERTRAPEIEKRARATTAEFHALQVTQRPTFVVQSEIGDKAVFSGTWMAAPIAAAIDAMLSDAAAYKSWAVHVGPVPSR